MKLVWENLTIGEVLKILSDPPRRKKFLSSLSAKQLVQFKRQFFDATQDFETAEEIPKDPVAMAGKYGRRWEFLTQTRHIRFVAEAVRNAIVTREHLMVMLPPRHAKSTVVSQWTPFWYLAHRPEEEVIFAAYGEDYARKWGGRVRQLVIENGRDYGLQLDPKQTKVTEWKLSRGGGMTSVGVGTGLPGRGTKLLILDDVVKDAAAAGSPAMRESLWEWWEQVAYTRLEPGGIFIAIGTMYHEDDILARLEKRSESGEGPKVRVIRLPAMAEENDPLDREVGEGLWLDQISTYSQAWYETKKRTMSPTSWNAVFQQRPSSPGGNIVHRDWWNWYTPSQRPEKFSRIFQTWDLKLKDKALKDKGEESFNAGAVIGQLDVMFFVLALYHERKGILDVIRQILFWNQQFPGAGYKLVEAKAAGPALIALLRGKVGGIVPVEPQGSKEARLDAVVPYIHAQQVYLPRAENGEATREVWELVEEFAQFPNSTNDDYVDAITQGLNFFGPAGLATVDTAHLLARAHQSLPTSVAEVHKQRFFGNVHRLVDDQFDRLREQQEEDEFLDIEGMAVE